MLHPSYSPRSHVGDLIRLVPFTNDAFEYRAGWCGGELPEVGPNQPSSVGESLPLSAVRYEPGTSKRRCHFTGCYLVHQRARVVIDWVHDAVCFGNLTKGIREIHDAHVGCVVEHGDRARHRREARLSAANQRLEQGGNRHRKRDRPLTHSPRSISQSRAWTQGPRHPLADLAAGWVLYGRQD